MEGLKSRAVALIVCIALILAGWFGGNAIQNMGGRLITTQAAGVKANTVVLQVGERDVTADEYLYWLAASCDAPAHRPPDLLHEPCVLTAPLLQIPGKHPEQRPQHQNTRRKTDDAVYRRLALPQEHIDEVQQDRRPQHGQPQLIHTVAPVHETRQRVAYALQKVHSTVPLRPAAMPQVF